MDIDQLISQIEETAKYCRAQGQHVKINTGLPWVNVYRAHDDVYFFQGEEASNLLDEVPEYVTSEDYILWSAQGW